MENWQKSKSKLEKKYGKWYTYNLIQKSGRIIITDIPEEIATPSILFYNKIADCAQDLNKKPLKDSNVLDLGCSEGLASFVFAGYGAKSVLGVEGREANIAKAKFTRDLLKLDDVDLVKKDVRNIKVTRKFDIVLALGILYHLDAPEVFKFVEKLYKLTNEVLILDTHIAMVPKIKKNFKGQEYFGLVYTELKKVLQGSRLSVTNLVFG